MTNSFIDPRFTLAEGVIVGHGCVLSGSGCISAGVVIGHHVVIEGDVQIGEGTRIGHHSVLQGPLRIGPGNEIFPHVSLGLRAQHPDYLGDGGPVIIGKENVLREYVSIHGSTYEPMTFLGNQNYLMAYSHVSHDCRIGNKNKFAMHATLAGHVTIGDSCYLGMHAVLHQRVMVGNLCMIGMNQTIKRHVPPFALISNKRFERLNARGLSLRGMTETDISEIDTRYRRGTSDDPASALQTVIDDFYASVNQGGIYRYEKAQAE